MKIFQANLTDCCLPNELTLHIFIRLPFKSLAQLKLLSRKWNFLISSNDFAEFLVQFSNFTTLQTLIFQSKNFISSLKFDASAVDNDDDDLNKSALSTTLLEHPLPESRKGVYYYCAGSYNGVVCVHIATPELHEQILLWNPITRERRPVPLPPISADDPPFTLNSCFKRKYWFGYVDLLDDVIIFHLKETRSYVYSMKNNRWRESRNSGEFIIKSEKMPCRSLGSRFVHKDGVLYYALGLDSILKFDLVNETLARMPFLQHFDRHFTINNEAYSIIDAAIGVTQENNLCSGRVFRNPTNDKWVLEIWKWVESTEWGWWRRLGRFCLGEETPGTYPWVIGFTYEAKIFVGGKKLVLVDPNRPSNDNVKEVETKHTAVYTVSYVETLLSPFSLL